ncbi:hypothetical protein BDV25DRAFT_129375 [Aspergillus avenaceus]|uniref:Cyclase-domain-containing protein n=1 Tax=Aspergillus avenaceus TaxID=36643 RepID=A0A5N6TWC7_ASPAV|nr:hypothetical protein BDV25DRAFT_129375 [Aspergillus avenaceus]
MQPSFSELPLNPADPPYSAWGLWGHDDEAGTLNLLDENTVTQAAKEIQLGHRFSLNWSLSLPRTPQFQRHTKPFTHSLHFNTQKGSQIDGLRHFAYQKAGLFYNGKTKDDIIAPGSSAYAERHGKTYDASGVFAIAYDDLMACLAEQSQMSREPIEFRKGDILLVRSGYTQKYLQLAEDEERKLGHKMPPETCGVGQDERMLRFLWEKQVAVVGGDAPAWECLPPVCVSPGFLYHEVLLLVAGWGCPIAELLWLEDLAHACNEHGRWTFFFTSAPLNVPGGDASPANMVAML